MFKKINENRSIIHLGLLNFKNDSSKPSSQNAFLLQISLTGIHIFFPFFLQKLFDAHDSIVVCESVVVSMVVDGTVVKILVVVIGLVKIVVWVAFDS